MDLFVSLVTGTVGALLTAVEVCFFLRAILSWLPLSEDNPFIAFTALVTEPIILPIRALFDRFGWFRDFPIDVPFFVAFLLLHLVSTALFVF